MSVALVAVTIVSAMPAEAQVRRPSVGLSGGLATSTSEFNLNGHHIQAMLDWQPTRLPLGLRLDALTGSWAGNRLNAALLNVSAFGPSMATVRPYAMMGAGVYKLHERGAERGWSLGGGLRIPALGRTLVAESKLHVYHASYPSTLPVTAERQAWRYIWAPVTLGVQF